MGRRPLVKKKLIDEKTTDDAKIKKHERAVGHCWVIGFPVCRPNLLSFSVSSYTSSD
jgi:hypothetical protein